ncbi:MAG: hypothetical protein J5I93_13645 [Pirellulaceae bacterium]|nr:hypothetical protein [Pirellulaceae bacterium]
MRQHFALPLLPGLLLFLSGCGGGPAVPVDATGPAAATKPAVEVSVKSWAETQQLVAQHPGRVVVIDLWTTW